MLLPYVVNMLMHLYSIALCFISATRLYRSHFEILVLVASIFVFGVVGVVLVVVSWLLLLLLLLSLLLLVVSIDGASICW